MKGAGKPQKPNRPRGAANIRGQLLGHAITTKSVVPTSARAIGAQVSDVLQPFNAGNAAKSSKGLLSGKAFVAADLLAAWPEIVGERLAGLCLPVRLKAAPKSRSRHKKVTDDAAILEVRADPAVAIDLSYGQALIVERLNAFYGYVAIGSLKVLPRHGDTTPTRAHRIAPQPPVTASAQSTRQAGTSTQGVEDEKLRAALTKLGALVLAAPRSK